MFKMETDNHNFRINVATEKKYILRKVGLKFQNPKISISCKLSFSVFFVIKCEM